MTQINTEAGLLVVGSYALATEPGLHLVRFNAAANQFTLIGQYTGIANPSFLVIHPNRRWLYAVSETSAGSVWALKLAAAPPTLIPINQQPSGGDDPCHLQLDPSGQWLLVSNYSSGSVAVFPLQPDGSVGAMSDRVQHSGSSIHPGRQEKAHAHSTCFTADGRFVIVADLGLDELRVYALAPETGRLTPQARFSTRPGAGPRHMVFHPRGRVLYSANELDNTVTVYGYDAGQLQVQQTLTTLPPGVSENAVAHILITPSGRWLYVSNRGHNSIALFAVADNGHLTHQGFFPCAGDWPRHFTLSSNHLFVANQYSHTVTALLLHPNGSDLSLPLANVAILAASCVQSLPSTVNTEKLTP
jgi:6-phosphogluconolactonase